MKLRITQLKAPWPPGARVGHVVELERIPGWAVGKCERVGDDEPVTAEWPKDASDSADERAAQAMQSVREEALAAIEEAKAEHAEHVRALELRLGDSAGLAAKLAEERDAAVKSADALRAQLAEASAQVDALRAQIAGANKPEPKGKGGK